uniref:Sushi domain-containing protein n=1 Tax=Macrostomum lignano TaxID=282301 RepID=A0A1I8GKC4_9PLAT
EVINMGDLVLGREQFRELDQVAWTAKAGFGLGVGAIALIFVVLVVWCCCRRHHQQSNAAVTVRETEV